MSAPINYAAIVRRVTRAARKRLPAPFTGWKVVRGDQVVIIAGRDKGKEGKIVEVLRDTHRVIVQGVNMNKRFVSKSDSARGCIVEVESPMHLSNVSLLDPVSGKATRVNWVRQESGTFERIATGSQTIIPKPAILSERRKPKPKTSSKDTLPEDVLEVTYRPGSH